MFTLTISGLCKTAVILLTFALLPYTNLEQQHWLSLLAAFTLIILTAILTIRLTVAFSKAKNYVSILLLLAFYLCLISLFSSDGAGLAGHLNFYSFLPNPKLPFLTYKIFVPFPLFLMCFDTADRVQSSDTDERNFPGLVRFFVIGITLLIPTLLFLSYGFGVPLTGALATSGLLTAIIGLALQGNLSNIISGVFLNVEKAFDKGDWITFDGQLGQVKSISWRSTRLTSIENKEIFVPNDKLAQSTVINLAKNDTTFSKGGFISYDSIYVHPRHNPQYIIDLLKDALANARPADLRPFFGYTGAFFVGGKENGLEFSVAYDCIDRALLFNQRSSIMLSINYVFTRAGVTMTVGNLLQNLKPDASLAVIQDFSQDFSSFTKPHTTENNIYLESQNAELWFRRIGLLAPLRDKDFSLLAKDSVKRTFAVGKTIINQGDPGKSMFVIVEGVAQVTITNTEGASAVLAKLTIGEVFGEMSLLTGADRSATVSAIRPVVVYEIKKETFSKIIKNNSKVLDGLSTILTNRQEKLNAARMELEDSADTKPSKVEIFSMLKKSIATFFAFNDSRKKPKS